MISKRVKSYCKDDISLIENYEEAINSEEKYDCHHRLETELNMSVKELIEKDLYYNRPASELIFLTQSEHVSLHFTGKPPVNKGKVSSYKGIPRPEEVRKKISKSSIGKTISEETKRKMSESHKKKKAA